MDRTESDRNLLFGILAFQNAFISREALLAAMQAWLFDKARPLSQILREQGALDAERHALLEALVRQHLKQHGDDAQKSLAAVSSVGSVREQLNQIADSDLHGSLAHVAADRKEEDPYASRALSSVGTLTSSGLRFRVLRPYAKGGLGQVSVALDEELHREVALKEIQARYADNPESRARFLLEAEVTGGLEHPGVVPVYGLGQYDDGRPFYAMRFIRGDNLKHAIERFHEAEKPGRDPGERALAFRKLLGRFVDVCNAIAYAHSRGVLHRDLKPGNVMLGQYGETLVVDWGLAKPVGAIEPTATGERPLQPSSGSGSAPTEMGRAMGTPAYMSPEQAAGRLDELGPASDVYSLGATLYHLLTGKPPFEGEDNGVILQRVQQGDFLPPRRSRPEVPPALEAVCLKAMALRPEDRYGEVRALASDVEHWLADEPVSAWPEPWGVRMRRWVGRHRTGVTAATAAALVALGSLTVATLLLTEANEHERNARELAEQKEKEAQRANAALAQSRDSLQKAHDQLQGTLARSLLASLAPDSAFAPSTTVPLTDPGVEALWQLAEARGEGFGVRFVEEAARRPITSGQLRSRTEYALHAALGLDAEKRARVEQLLRRRLEGAGLTKAQRRDLALATGALGHLRPQTAGVVGRILTEAVTATNDPDTLERLGRGLWTATRRLDPPHAGEVADTLVAAIARTSDAYTLRELARDLGWVSGRLGRAEAATLAGRAADTLVAAMTRTKTSSDLRELAWGLEALSGRLDAARAATCAGRAADAVVAALRTRQGVADAYNNLLDALAAVSGRLDGQRGGKVADALIAALTRTDDPLALSMLASSLALVSEQLEPTGAAARAGKVADALVAALTRPGDRSTLANLAGSLGALSRRLDPAHAGRAADALVAALTRTDDEAALRGLGEALKAVSGGLEPTRAGKLADTLVAALVKSNDFVALQELGWGLWAVSGRVEAARAGKLADALVAAMPKTKDPLALSYLAWGLEAVSGRLGRVEAAGYADRAADGLVTALARANGDVALRHLGRGLEAVGGQLDAERAGKAAETLVGALSRANGPTAIPFLARALQGVSRPLRPAQARNVADALVAALTSTHNVSALRELARGLADVSARLGRDQATAHADKAAQALVAAMTRTTEPAALGDLAESLTWVLGDRLGRARAAAYAGRAAKLLVAFLPKARDAFALHSLAHGLACVIWRLEPSQSASCAAKVADALTKPLTMINQAVTRRKLAQSAGEVSRWLGAAEATRVAAALIAALPRTGDADAVRDLERGLLATLIRQDPRDDARRVDAVTGAAGILPGTTCPFGIPAFFQDAAKAPPPPLPAQTLVNLLKHPLCVSAARRAVLDQLQRHYGRRFADQWDFVRFARERHLPLDLTSPPQRLFPGSAGGR